MAADFNPRSREGSDQLPGALCSDTRNFNPRSREGSDWYDHASHTGLCHFNPRSREGSDIDGPLTSREFHEFQSTLP